MPVKRTEPTMGLDDKNFRYRNAAQTDIRKTFARIERERKAAVRQDSTGQQLLTLEPPALTVVRLSARARGAA